MTRHTDTPAGRPPAPALPVRTVEVSAVRRLSPRMVRVTLGGPALADFSYEAPDQQVKLYFPRPGQSVPRLPEPGADGDVMRWYGAFQAIPEDERPWMRSYTIRAHDAERGTVDVDFVLHEGPDAADSGGGGAVEGPATRWARSAGPGDMLGMFGPSAYFAEPVPLGTTDWMLLAGDESALPAIGTIVEALPAGARAVAYVEVWDAAEEQRFESAGEVTVHWLHRAPSAGDAAAGGGPALVEAVRAAVFPAGSVFAWLGGEADTVRALRRHLVGERGLDRRSVHFTGYWRRRLTHDDAPTDADLAEARERLADRS
ncbi:siderophore-interacting protein [Streptomyces sp. NBC_00838]|uniref:siderophore-interacting protein n=1 Tax=Streptomyces sp. NBC_00838 TaxID=2903680 RepID=UPI0038692F34|nr:siderophore-interacting protein [Streptomyces sp. NBC_00838]